MARRTKRNKDMPVGQLKRVEDVLPPPEELATPEATVKVTIALTKRSIDFFKREARKHRSKYQKMIRDLVDRYASHY